MCKHIQKDKWLDVREIVHIRHRYSLYNSMWSCISDYVHAYTDTEMSNITDMHWVKKPILEHLTSKE